MPTPEVRPPADHESADACVVAPVNAGQQGGTSFKARLKDAWDWVPPDVRQAFLMLLVLVVYACFWALCVGLSIALLLTFIFRAAQVFVF